MAISITIDNDSGTAGTQTLVNDQSAGTQTPASPDTGNDSNIDVTDATVPSGATPDSNLFDGTLSGASYSAAFLSFLNSGSIFGSGGLRLNDTQKAFAANVDGAVSSSSFVTVTASAGETISNLMFSDSSGAALNGQQVAGMHTLDGGNVYLFSDGDFAIATTSATAGAGRVVAAFYLNEAANHLSAQVQMVTFEALQHPDANNPDDALNFTDVLQVSAQGTMSFNFDNLPSGSFLYAAVGNSSAGLLVTGQDLNVNDTAGSKLGDLVTGGSDPSDTVNTSQGGIGATIGINSQHFTDQSGGGGTKIDGAVGVFTLVKGFGSFDATINGTSEGTGSNVNEITYSDYVNAPSAKIFISQSTGSSSIGGAVRVTLWEAGGGALTDASGNPIAAPDHAPGDLKPEVGYSDTANTFSYIGNQDKDSHLRDDTPVAVGSVTVSRLGVANPYVFTGSGGTQGGITVVISANGFTVTGLHTSDTLGFSAANDPNNALDGTFNRFDVQALANSNPVDIGRIDLDQGVSISQGIGSDLIVQDDGPSIIANPANAPSITDDESALGTDNTGDYSGNFTPTFGTDGAGATPRSYALSTTAGVDSGVVDTATNQHVFLFKVGDNIVGKAGTDAANALAGSTVVFVVSTDQNGVVTLDQQRAVVHADPNNPDDSTGLTGSNKVVLTATAYDGDGDHAAAPLDLTGLLNFKDDGPTMTANPTGAPLITDDESFLGTDNTGDYSANFTAVFGNDGAGATPRSYSLSTTAGADSGLIESGTGLHVFMFKVGDNLVGKSGTNSTTAASGTTVFVVSINQSGVVTLDQQRAVVHDPNSGVDQSTTLSSAGLVVVNATAFDGDGDHAADSLNIGQLLNFKDDAPTITSQIQDGEVTFTQNASVSHSLNGAIGADGTSSTQTSFSLGTAEYTISYWDTTPTNVFPNLNAVLSNNGTVLTYYSDVADTNAVYRLTLDPLGDSGHGTYTFQVLQPPPVLSTNFGFTDLPSGQNLDGTIATNKSNVVNGVLPDGGLLVFPSNPILNSDGTFTNTSGTINTSKGGGPVTIGNGNQAFDSPQEGAYFMYVDNPAASSVGGLGLTQTSADDADTIRFNGLNQSTDSSVSIVQTSGAGSAKRPGPTVHIATWEAPLDFVVNSDAGARALVSNPVTATNATQVSITDIKIHDSTGKVVEWGHFNSVTGMTDLKDVTGDGQVTGADNVGSVITFINDNLGGTAVWSANVTQLRAGYTIEFLTASSHNIALVQDVALSGNTAGSFDIGGFSASNQVTVPAQTFHFAATITDYDNDAYGGHLATFADWNVTIDSVVP